MPAGVAGPHQLQTMRLDQKVPDDTTAPYYAALSSSANAATSCTNVPTGSFAHRCYAFTSYNQVKTVSETGTTLTYTYDEMYRRETVVEAGANPGFREYFPVAGVESERRVNHDSSGNVTSVEWADYIMLGGELVGEYASTNATGGTNKLLYFHNDAQGTVTAITGGVTEEDSVDAWGKERNLDGTPDAGVQGSGGGATCALETTDAQSRGWLGQESLAKSGICIKNLNARLYDPLTASFASADTVVGHPFSTQGWNRYAYGGGNPLANADPTGMCFGGCFWKQPLFRDVVGIAVAFALDNPEWGVLALDGFATGSAINVGIAGAASGAVSTGTLKGTLISLAEANSFDSIGDIKEVLTLQNGSLGSILMHGTAGGLFSMAQGGKFQSGFLAAGFAELAGPVVDDLARGNIYVGTAASAVTGGLGSVLGGGKFENGAVTGAFGYLFNSAQHRQEMAAQGAAVGFGATVAGSVVVDAATGGWNILATPAEVWIGSAGGWLAGWAGGALSDLYNGTWSENNGKIGPGPYAGTPIPAGPSARPTAEQRKQINDAGNADGCHTCGTDDPGTTSGNWVGDHQPPTALNPPGNPQVYYPQCLSCSLAQGGLVNGVKQSGGGTN